MLAASSRFPDADRVSLQQQGEKNETPEIAPLHTDSLPLSAVLSEKHTHRHADTHTRSNSSPPDILSAYMTQVTLHVHSTLHAYRGAAGFNAHLRPHTFLRELLCVYPASLRRLCGES